MNQLSLTTKLLVIAQTGRMLAQMLRNAGLKPIVVDCFADADTCELALEAVRVADLSVASLQPVLEDLQQRHQLTQIVYGSGFESFPDSLDYLQRNWQLLGNSPGVFKQLQDKTEFFRLLQNLHINHPETVFEPPVTAEGWLQKPMQGLGGRGIVQYHPTSGKQQNNCYWQRQLDGLPMSLTFIATADKVDILGINLQWTIVQNHQPFRFSGLANHAGLSAENQQILGLWLGKLVRETGLRGLGSLDFMLLDDQCHILEINARIPASAQLYEPHPTAVNRVQVFDRHIQALQTVAPSHTNTPYPAYYLDSNLFAAAGYQVIYASSNTIIPSTLNWPKWVMDIPQTGAITGKGQPICSIIAYGNNQAQVLEQLRNQQRFIENILNTGS
jgi:predicted ATP-grasp superfamily ATP-dependent carboligase